MLETQHTKFNLQHYLKTKNGTNYSILVKLRNVVFKLNRQIKCHEIQKLLKIQKSPQKYNATKISWLEVVKIYDFVC